MFKKMLRMMMKDCANINDQFTFMSLVGIYNGHNYSRDELLTYFCELGLWRYIPAPYLYNTYVNMLSDVNIVKGRDWYKDFFEHDIVVKISELNKHDTVENPELISLLDENGELTVYNGNCKRIMHNAHTWTLKKEDAINVGRITALVSDLSTFYCTTGKVPLSNVIAKFQNRCYKGIAVLNKNVRKEAKECYDAEDVPIIKSWGAWV